MPVETGLFDHLSLSLLVFQKVRKQLSLGLVKCNFSMGDFILIFSQFCWGLVKNLVQTIASCSFYVA